MVVAVDVVLLVVLVVVCVGLLGVNRLTRGSIKHPRKFVQIFDRSWKKEVGMTASAFSSA